MKYTEEITLSKDFIVEQLEFSKNNFKKTFLIRKLQKKITKEMENKYFPEFETNARYLGNGVYSIPFLVRYSTDLRELFLMFIAFFEHIKFKDGY